MGKKILRGQERSPLSYPAISIKLSKGDTLGPTSSLHSRPWFSILESVLVSIFLFRGCFLCLGLTGTPDVLALEFYFGFGYADRFVRG